MAFYSWQLLKVQFSYSDALHKAKPLKSVGVFFSAVVPHASKYRWQVIKYRRGVSKKKKKIY